MAFASAPAATGTINLKKGLGVSSGAEGLRMAERMNVAWYYTWWYTKPPQSSAKPEFVPMVWGSNGDTPNQVGNIALKVGARYLLGFNEPDSDGQSNMTVDRAVGLWPDLERCGLPLGSPAAVHADGKWMRSFMAQADAKHLRVDVICVHWYSAPDPDTLLKYLAKIHDLYHRPIWLTEFGVVDWDQGPGHPGKYTPKEVAGFLHAVLPKLNALPYLQRYSWYTDTIIAVQ